MKKVLLSAVAAVALTTATHAASPFSGFYLGGGFGFNSSKASAKTNNTAANPVTILNRSRSASSLSLLTFMGYGNVFTNGMYLGGELTLGYEGSAKFGQVKNEANAALALAANRIEATYRAKGGFTGELAARLGYVFCNKTLVYGKFGYAWQPKMEGELKDTVTNTTSKKSYSRNGLVLGAGVEHAISNNWLVRAEYKYNFGTKSKSENLNFALPHKNEVKTSAHTLTLGVAYKI